MRYDPQKHHRRSIRLPHWDYTQAGCYFVTLCTQCRECLFGHILDGVMELNEFGCVVQSAWLWLNEQYDYIKLGNYIVKPNHLHGVIIYVDSCRGDSRRGDSRIAPTTMKRKPLGRLVGAFKTVSTKHINQIHNTPGEKVWQRNYYEHIIRDENELMKIRNYIDNNPIKWEMDRNHPENIKI